MPYDTKVSTSPVPSVNDPDTGVHAVTEERARRRALERAAKRFQTVTKEEDWSIARTYVALAATGSSSGSSSSSNSSPPPDKEEKEWIKSRILEGHLCRGLEAEKAKVSSVLREEEESAHNGAPGSSVLRVETAARAVDAYLDDDEWEERERARGRGPSSKWGSDNTSRRSGGRGSSSWFSAWKSEKML